MSAAITGKRALLALGAVAALCLAWLTYSWLRDSSLVRVKDVEVTGLTADQAPQIRRALTAAAQNMTTMNVDENALKQSVSSFPVVKGISTSPDFPNKLGIRVIEYKPSAVVADSNGKRVAVAGDGTLLPRVDKNNLPAVKVDSISTSGKVQDPESLEVVELLGAAPTALRSKLERAFWGPSGVRVKLREGPTIQFGSPDEVEAKWRGAARVLADPSSDGATLIDVRIPERPAASGFPAGTPGTAGAPPPSDGTEDETVDPTVDPTVPTEPGGLPEAPPTEETPVDPNAQL